MTTRVVTAHLPSDLAVQVDQLAQRLERPRAWIIKEALTAWVALEEKRHQLTLQALTDAKAGDVVEHAQIERWAKTLNASA
jgi:predicted transcriptional regulator